MPQAQSDYNVNIIVTTKDKTSGPAKKAAKGMDGLQRAVKMVGTAFAVLKMARVVTDLGKLGASAKRQANALNNLAQEAGTSGDAITKAIQQASNFTIDKMSAMQAANRAMVMDVAQTPEEFERLTKVAVSLGRAMGVDATKSIDDFVTASARQSQMIADNLGLTVTVGAATERYAAKLGITVDQLTDAQKKQAFFNMMLEEGEKKLGVLGSELDEMAKIEILTAAINEAKVGIGEWVVELVAGTQGIEAVAERIRGLGTTLKQVTMLWLAYGDALYVFQQGGGRKKAMEEFENSLKRQVAATIDFKVASEELRYVHLQGNRDFEAQAKLQATLREITVENTSSVRWYTTAHGIMEASVSKGVDSFNQYQSALEWTDQAQDDTALSALELAKSQKVAADVADELTKAELTLSVSFTRQLGQMQESTEEFNKRREELETEHQATLAELRERGQAKAIWINETAERKKLADLQYSLDYAKARYDEMGEGVAESTRMATERRLATAQAEFNAQQKLLDDYASGRLVSTGENVDALIEEEKRLHNEKLAMIDAEMAKQQEQQQQALGQLLLQTVDMWAKASGKTDVEMQDMRVGIMEEYGLIQTGSRELVNDLLEELDRWDTDGKVSTDNLISYFGSVVDEQGNVKAELVELTAEEWVIRVRYEQYGSHTARTPEGFTGPDDTGLQHGGGFMVGEAGPEFVTVQPLGGNTYNYHETYNVANPGTMAAMDETRRRRRAAYGRTM
jgi:hypothetical protein